ncbi:MarR family winged helix-turn-helix transcriptional regulator [Kocuria sp. SM24M-10]|uniref:MarR family winged helix-turn-helix transcriptional regulator n=1 Tax=Kocuria sp. SM24M-10 TaxID=1660349 RepID=UPI0006495C5E|nr:MarR family transcriptional regulator [Kocuria sp. SM24M-10]KLU09657.1 hypothetical protein ABL57_11145 [Kocuria sp. SM24M-10]
MTDPLGTASALVRLSFLVQSVYATVCAQHDLTPAQAQLLCVLKDQPRAMAELVAMLRLEKSSLSGLVDRVERQGLLSRHPSPVDRRAVRLALTTRGQEVAEQFYEEATTALEQLVQHLPVTEQRCFTQITHRILLEEAVPEIFGTA